MPTLALKFMTHAKAPWLVVPLARQTQQTAGKEQLKIKLQTVIESFPKRVLLSIPSNRRRTESVEDM
jgi:hypothetical protein